MNKLLQTCRKDPVIPALVIGAGALMIGMLTLVTVRDSCLNPTYAAYGNGKLCPTTQNK
jgi:hypothetical protein